MRWLRHLLALSLSLVAIVPLAANEGALDATVPAFIKQYCLECHNASKEKGDRSFESFLQAPSREDQLETLEEILNALNLGEMPPERKNVQQPSDQRRRAITDEISRYLKASESSKMTTATVLRRLSRHEYNNTMRDLLGVHPESSDATSLFPIDRRHDGFVNVGSAQVLSNYQLELYLKAARFYLDQALVFDQPRTPTRTWTFKPEDFIADAQENGRVWYRVLDRQKRHVDIGHGQPVERYPTYPEAFAEHGVPVGGHYRIRVTATAVGRDNPYDPDVFRTDLSMPLKMGLWHVPDKALLAKGASEGRIFVEAFDLPDNRRETFEVTAWMPAGSTPFMHWINGEASKPLLRKVRERHHPECLVLSQSDIDRLKELGKPVPPNAGTPKVWLSDVYQGPRVRIFEMTLEGPLIDRWPPKGHRNIIGDVTDADEIELAQSLTAFAAKAFRRPVKTEEVAHYIRYVEERIDAGIPASEAIQLGLSAILTSPRFLFLDEGDPEQDQRLDGFELASRLSYMLWCSMPDDRLLGRASSEELGNPNVLLEEAARLLADPRSKEFTNRFTEAWLRLDKIGSMPPSDNQYPTYYRRRLEAAMKTETRLFFDDCLDNNRPVTQLLSADFSYVNDALAKHYGLDGDFGEPFERVSLPPELRRGGLLGHASVLTATANGVETSPVVRGVWVLENMLGTPPSPPPPDVPPIEPDTRGATTIREQLAKHRSVAACADCHAKIDPWGFALEFYDPIGGLRSNYPVFTDKGRVARNDKGRPIDGSGSLPTGEFIQDESDLKQLLVARRDQFARMLTHKLITYATGREITFRDHDEVDRIVRDVASRGYGLRDLVAAVITSEVFRRR